MLQSLTVISLAVWVPVFAHLVARQGFSVLLALLFIAPVASNLAARPGKNPFFGARETVSTTQQTPAPRGYWKAQTTSIRLNELLSPVRVIISLSFIVFFVRTLLQRKRFGLDRTETLMFIFSLFLIANVVLHSNSRAYALRTATDAFIIPFMTYYIARRLVITEEHLHRLIRVLAYVGCYIIVLSLVERLSAPGLTFRVRGPFEYNQTLQVALAVPFFAVLGDWLGTWKLKNYVPSLRPEARWFILCFSPVIILLTWSRGNWLGFFLGAWIFLFLAYRLISASRKIGIIGVLLLSIPLIAVLVLVIEPPERMLSRIGNVNTVESRFTTWNAVAQIGVKHPFTGIGLFNLRDYVVEQGNWDVMISAHNCYLSLFAELGTFGLLLYLAIVASIIKEAMRLYREKRAQTVWLGIAIIAIMAAYQVPSLFANNLYLTEISHVFVFVLIGGITGLDGQYRSILGQSVSFGYQRNSNVAIPALR